MTDSKKELTTIQTLLWGLWGLVGIGSMCVVGTILALGI